MGGFSRKIHHMLAKSVALAQLSKFRGTQSLTSSKSFERFRNRMWIRALWRRLLERSESGAYVPPFPIKSRKALARLLLGLEPGTPAGEDERIQSLDGVFRSG